MANEKRLIDANALKNEMLEENPYIHFGPFGYCACSPKTDGELVFKREEVLRAIDSAPTVDAVEVQEFEKQKQEALKWMDEYIAEWRGYSQSYVDIPHAKVEAMEIAKQIVNRYICGAKMDGGNEDAEG